VLKVTSQEERNEERPCEREKKQSLFAPDKQPRETAKVSSEPVANIEDKKMEGAEEEWVYRWIGGDN
jgi:hypothetical protein